MKRENTSARLLLFATPPHDCGYLQGEAATTVFADPRVSNNTSVYTMLSRYGFRRSGNHLYRPQCERCSACVPVRVSVKSFRARRNQRRVWTKNRDLGVRSQDQSFTAEHFMLYRRYIRARHRGGSMDNPSEEQYREFLPCEWGNTIFFEFRCQKRLVAVAVTDILNDGMSAVYTFFDPRLPKRSLGAYAILWQIEEARRRDLDWLYLGYWIQGSPKMQYKGDYRPQQRLIDGRWRDY
jgi:arginyl-tRNA--protein-N-Asp/Glu arginylyltransferase